MRFSLLRLFTLSLFIVILGLISSCHVQEVENQLKIGSSNSSKGLSFKY
jgi:hypothetical protein